MRGGGSRGAHDDADDDDNNSALAEGGAAGGASASLLGGGASKGQTPAGRGFGGLGGLGGMDIDMKFASIAGVIAAEEQPRFARMLYRATRGNCFFHFMEVEQLLVDPKTGRLVRKVAFVVFFKGITLEHKIQRVATAFGATTYDVGELALGDAAAVRRSMRENAHELQDARLVLLKNREERLRACTRLAGRLEAWAWPT